MNFIWLVYIFFPVLIIILFELLFLKFYKLKKKSNYEFREKINLDKITVESHPYLPFIYKKNANVKGGLINYPLNKSIEAPNLKLNSLRFANGIKGDKEIILPKPKELIRINCLGASTTGNYIKQNNENYSYPIILQNKLNKHKENIEVNNCAQGGYNSLDILIRFQTSIVDTDPDIIILYHAYNDIRSYLTNNISPDYFHSRLNFPDKSLRFILDHYLPNPKINFLNYLRSKFLQTDLRLDLLNMVTKGKFEISNEISEGLRIYKRNISFLLDICVSKKIDVLMSTFCFYLHDNVKHDELHKRYFEIVLEENKIIKELAKKYEFKCVDLENLVPKNEKYFLDTIHFSKDGMEFVADEFYKEIKKKV